MPYWAIYVTDPERFSRTSAFPPVEAGTLREVVSEPPSRVYLDECGLGAAYFGEDAPDLARLEWCPRRLSFVERAQTPPESRFAARLAIVEARLARLQEPAEAPAAEATAARPGFWRRLLARLRGEA